MGTIDSQTYLSVDLGGTKLLIGEVDRQGNIRSQKRYPGGFSNMPDAIEAIEHHIQEYLTEIEQTNRPKPLAIGMGVVGRVNGREGIWYQMDHNPTEPLLVSQRLEARFQIPCWIDNDVKSATTAELVFGYGGISKNFIYLNIGTGIAAGFVIEGRLLRGSHFNSGEIGHMVCDMHSDVMCVCGRRGCVETIASGGGIDRNARLYHSQFPDTKLLIRDDQKVNVSDVYRLCSEGDALCRQLVDNAAESIAALIMNLVRVTDPDTFVLGGGVVSDGFLYPLILERLNSKTIRFVKNGVQLTKLNPAYIGLIGGAAVAIDHLENKQ